MLKESIKQSQAIPFRVLPQLKILISAAISYCGTIYLFSIDTVTSDCSYVTFILLHDSRSRHMSFSMFNRHLL